MLKIFLTLVLNTNIIHASLINILLIDTGIKSIDPLKPYLIQNHKDDAVMAHGTEMALIVAYGLNSSDYKNQPKLPITIESCNPFIQRADGSIVVNERLFLNCLEMGKKFNYILMALSGPTRIRGEDTLLKKLDVMGVRLIISAGNDSVNLNDNCNRYPVCYIKQLSLQNAVGVGGINSNNKKCSFTNTASWLQWELGCSVPILISTKTMTIQTKQGTSHAAALYLHNTIKKTYNYLFSSFKASSKKSRAPGF